GSVLCVRWMNLHGRLLASGSDDHNIVVWTQDTGPKASLRGFGETTDDVEKWKVIKVLRGHDSDVVDLAWSHDNRFLASAGLDSAVYIWDAKNFEKVKKIEAHTGFVKGITWDPVGKYLATASDDKTLKIWRVSDWELEKEIGTPYALGSSITFFRRLSWSPDGAHIATSNGENATLATAPVIGRDGWGSEINLVGHQGPVEVAVSAGVTVGSMF
ncbi:WD40-repeat-containing domain protein, partial [Blyttiomyces helicus]